VELLKGVAIQFLLCQFCNRYNDHHKEVYSIKIEGNVVSLKMDNKILKLVRITSLIVVQVSFILDKLV
jgi:hypothetical protein